MHEFRYDDTARTFDEELEKDLFQLLEEAEAKEAAKHEPEAETGIQRIAKGKTPLDEVRAIIDASRQKSAQQEITEHRVRRKLAAYRDGTRAQVEDFINLAKNG